MFVLGTLVFLVIFIIGVSLLRHWTWKKQVQLDSDRFQSWIAGQHPAQPTLNEAESKESQETQKANAARAGG